MVIKALKEFLDRNLVKYVTVSHSPAFTAQEIAQSADISGKELAKTVILKADGQFVMAVLPASHHVMFGAVERAIGARSVELAAEIEFKDRFPNCETGAMPPFGHLYGMKVLSASCLAQDKEIAFNAGTHTELIRLAYADYARLAKPVIAEFSEPR